MNIPESHEFVDEEKEPPVEEKIEYNKGGDFEYQSLFN
jgi:hypothetical protein